MTHMDAVHVQLFPVVVAQLTYTEHIPEQVN